MILSLLCITLCVVAQKEWQVLPASYPAPFGRRNAALWCINDDIYVYGGKNDLERDSTMWMYRKEPQTWTPTDIDNVVGISGMAYWGDGYMYGGRDDNHTVHAHVWKFGSGYLDVSGGGPGPRYGMFYWYTGKDVYIYGGLDNTLAMRQDLWKLNVDTLEWTLVGEMNEPGPMDDGYAIYDVRANNAYLFRDRLWSYDIASNTWSALSDVNGPSKSEDMVMWVDSPTNSVIVFSGKTDTQSLNTMWAYNIGTKIWTTLEMDHKPSPRWGSSMCGSMYLFGGASDGRTYNDLWQYSEPTYVWTGHYFSKVSATLSAITFVIVLITCCVLAYLFKNKIQRI